MSASELIEQIKALPTEELEIVRRFLLDGEAGWAGGAGVSYLEREEAKELGDKIMETHSDLFRRLAQ